MDFYCLDIYCLDLAVIDFIDMVSMVTQFDLAGMDFVAMMYGNNI
jgi:hypothetical protein